MLDDVLLDIEPVALSEDGITALDRLANQPDARWYYQRRRRALAAAGLLALGFNPMQPRGKDGKWIEVFGWVRWLEHGKWRRGQVSGWSKTDGSMLVKDDQGTNRVFKKQEIRDRIFTVTGPKATLKLPDPKNATGAPGFNQIGGQGGSNPGGLYQITDPSLVKGSAPFTPDMVRTALAFNGGKDALLVQKSAAPELLATDPFWGESSNALILDNADNKVFSKVSDSFWDLSTNELVTAEKVFGAPGSDRRKKVNGKIEVIQEAEGSFDYSDLIDTVASAKSMGGDKPNKDAKFYIKTSKSPDHARNEALANSLYELGGVPVPETSIGDDGITFSSRIVEGDEVNELSTVLNDQNVIDALKKDFVFDAWLANWDVVGLGFDNVKVVDGVPYRIDAGGALEYRAQGAPKGSMFGTTVGELDTLISLNPQSGKVFKGINDAQIKEGAERLAAITPQDIINTVEAHGLSKSLSDKLIARRKFILDKYDVEEPPIHIADIQSEPPKLPPVDVLPPLPPSYEPGDEVPKIFPSDISGMYYNADAKTFLPGKAPNPIAIFQHQSYLDAKTGESSVQSIYLNYLAGMDIQVNLNDGLWHVNAVNSIAPGTFTLDLTHAASGEKWSTYNLHPNDLLPARSYLPDDPSWEQTTAAYGPLWRNYRDHVANRYNDPKELFNDSVMGAAGTGMKTVGVGNWPKLVPGTWVLIPPGINSPEIRAYKVGSVVDDAVIGAKINGSDLNGDEVSAVATNWSAYHGLPGSLINETLDAMQARNIVAKTQEINSPDEPTLVAQNNIPTPTDTTMQKLSASSIDTTVATWNKSLGVDAVLDPTPDEILTHVQKTHPDATLTPDPPDLEPVDHFDPDSGVNKNLNVVGEVYETKKLDLGTAETLLGKKVYYRTIGASPIDRGVFTLDSVEPWIKSNPALGVRLNLLDASGKTHSKRSSFPAELFEIEGNIAPIIDYSEKKNGDIVVNGEVVGSWAKQMKSYWDGSTYPTGWWEATINGKYTVSGKDFSLQMNQKKQLKPSIVPMLLPPGSGGSKPKPAKVKEIQKQIVLQQIAFGGNIKETTSSGKAVTLMDGAEAKVGMWTISKTDGKIGKITSLDTPPQAGVPGSVYVEYDDPSTGKKMVKIRGAGTLSAAISPEGELPPGSPFFDKVKLGDGSKPFASQEVMDNTGAAVIIMGIKPDGSIRVLDLKTGDKKWVKSSSLKASKDYSKEVIVEVDADPAGVVAMSSEAWKTTAKAKKIPYAGPGGSVISQPGNAVEQYRQFAPGRKLTKDNFVPKIGMWVRDSKGDQYIIVRQNKTFDSNPSSVYVVDPKVGGKPKSRQPSALWVDHAAELSTWDGKPVPKVAKLNVGGNDYAFTDGSALYSYSMSWYTYSGNRAKAIRYIVITPDGKAEYINPAGNLTPVEDWNLQSIVSKGVSKVAYIDTTSPSTLTVEHEGSASTSPSKLWVHDSAPGALEDLKIKTAQDAHAAPPPAPVDPSTPSAPTPDPSAPSAPAPAPTSGPVVMPGDNAVVPEVFSGDKGTLVDLPKPTSAPEPSQTIKTIAPPAPQSQPDRLRVPPAVANSYSVDTGIKQLRHQMESGNPGERVLYTMGDTDYVEDMAIRLQSVVDRKTGQDMIEVRFRLLEDKADTLGTQLIANGGQVKVGGWEKTPLKGPKDIVVGDAISVRIGNGGVLKPANINAPNGTVVNPPVLVGQTPNGFDAYSIDIVTGGGAPGTIIVEQRATPSVPTYEWNPDKVISSSYFDASLNPQAAALGWSIHVDGGIGYEAISGVGAPDAKGRKIVDPNSTSFRSTGSLKGTMRLKYDGGEGSFMTLQVTHPGAEERQPNLFSGGSGYSGPQPEKSQAIRHSVNGEVLIRVPANDPHALDRISEMMSAAGLPPSAQGQPTGRDLRKMALNKVYKQFNSTYTHMDRPDVTGDDDASAQSVLALLDAQVKGNMPGDRSVTMDDIHLRVVDDGRMEVVLSDDVARALSKKAKYTFAYHNLNHGYDPLIWTSKAHTGLMSTDERWSAGIVVSGGSSVPDVTHDAGNRLYFRFSTADYIADNYHIILSPMAINKKLDNYWSPSDYWGRRHPENTAKQYLTQGSFGGGNEIKIKRIIDPEMMAYVLVSGHQRDLRLAELRAAGITHINGRPIEEIFVTASMINGTKVGELGANYGTEIPITAIPLGTPVPPPPAPGAPVEVTVPLVVAGGTMTGDIRFNTTSDYTVSKT